MNKSELVEQIASRAELSKAASQRALDAIIATVSETLKAGEEVSLVGFGTFKVLERAARKGRNPKTGEEISIAACKSPKFSAGKSLKDALK